MKKNIFAVCDLEESYARNLTDYMNERKNAPFEVMAFTSLDSLESFAKDTHIELLLISTDAMCEAVRRMDVERIVILSDGEPLPDLEEEKVVYKYQSSDSLIAEVMNYYAESSVYCLSETGKIEGVEVIGIYSPLNRIGKTRFALTLGDVLGEEKKVLYLNLEDYNGFEELSDQSCRMDLSDLIYFSRQKEGNLLYKLNSMIRSVHHLDLIPPAFSPGDLRDVSCEEWIRFIREVAVCGEYEVVILDIGNRVNEAFELMRQCTSIYVPVLEDDYSRAKLRQFEKNLYALEYKDVLERIRKIQLPPWEALRPGGEVLGKMMQGNMRIFVRTLAEKPSGKQAGKPVFGEARYE